MNLKQAFSTANRVNDIWLGNTNLGKGQNYEFHNVEIQKECRKKFKASERRKDLLKGSERRKRKRSEHRK